MIYIVNGFPGSGKTTFEDKVCQIVGDGSFGFKLSTVDFVKSLARQCGWDGTKDLHNRKFLSDLKDLLTQWDDVPYKKIENSIELIKADFREYDIDFEKAAIFVDCREPEEIKKLCDGLNAKSLLIRRGCDVNTETSNHADAEVLNYNYDIIINNDGTLYDLTQKAFQFIRDEDLYMPDKDFQVDIFGNIK